MSYEPTDESTLEELQNATENNDIVTNDELQSLYPDLNLGQIGTKLEADEAALKAANPNIPEEPRYEARKGMKSFRSGAKGVIADHNEAKLKLRARRIQENLNKKAKVHMQLDTSNQIQPFSIKYVKKKKNKKNNNNNNNNNNNKSGNDEYKGDSDNDSDLDSDDMDDEVMKLYKEEKLKMLEKYRPKYGNCMEVTAWTFDEKVENAPKDTYVVMHVYQDFLERCEIMNRSLAQLAKAYPHVCFLRARTDRIALNTYPKVGLPTIIIFKNGDQLQNHIALHTILETPFTAKIMQEFLIKHKVIEPSVEMIEKPTESTRESFLQRYGKNQKKPLKSSDTVDNDSDSGSELDVD